MKEKAMLHKKLLNNFVSQCPNFTRDTYTSRDFANMDQIPLPFVLDDNKTYDKKGD